MRIPVKAFAVPKEYRYKGISEFHLDDSELFLFDSFAQEHVTIAGTTMHFYHMDIRHSSRDALYDEPAERRWLGPYKIEGWIAWPEQNAQATEAGLTYSWEPKSWISRKEMEDAHAPPPNEGDIIQIWDIPLFYAEATAAESSPAFIPNAGYFFEVTNKADDGHLFDRPSFVGYSLNLRRNTDFSPERKVLPP